MGKIRKLRVKQNRVCIVSGCGQVLCGSPFIKKNIMTEAKNDIL
jgi:hypothetical protein